MARVILEAEPEWLMCAVKAAIWLHEQPETQKDAILSYGNQGDFYVCRNKASISSRQINRALSEAK